MRQRTRIEIRVFCKVIVRLHGHRSRRSGYSSFLSAKADNRTSKALEFIPGNFGKASLMNVWRLITHWNQPGVALKWSQENGRIAVGWGRAGDIRDYNSAREIVEAVREEYPGIQNAPVSWFAAGNRS